MAYIILNILKYFCVGFVEMFIVTQRTYWISKGHSRAAALLVFFETFVAMYIIYQISHDMGGNWLVMGAYASGNAIGTYINLEKVPF